MTFNQFVASVRKKDPQHRDGQHYMNVLHQERYWLYDAITTDGSRDPFYDDDKIPEFLEFVGTYWD